MNTAELHGLVELSNDEYHAAPGVSNSRLKWIARSPLHYWDRYINPDRETEEKTPAMALGNAIHKAILEPDLFASRYAGGPAVKLNTNKGKAEWAAFEAENLGKTLLRAEEYDICIKIRDAAHRDAGVANLLRRGRAEQSYFTTDRETGELIKCQPDFICDEWPLVLDLKSAEDASEIGFGRAAANYGYWRQGPWYTDILDELRGDQHVFGFLAFEKERPFAVGVYYLEPEEMVRGRRHNRRLLNRIAACRREFGEARWPGYASEPQPLRLPGWYKRQLEIEEEEGTL